MHDKYKRSVVSPDGRFEIVIEEENDRGFYLYETVLIERATGKRLFTWDGLFRAEFDGDGILAFYSPIFESGRVQIYPEKLAFRTDPSGPWVPLAAWKIMESAYIRGYDSGSNKKRPTPFPWVEIIGLLISVGALPALVALDGQPLHPNPWIAAHMILAAIGVVVFSWLTARDLLAWTRERIEERKERRSWFESALSARE